MKELIKKTFSLKVGNKTFFYKQATLKECMEFDIEKNKEEFDLIVYLKGELSSLKLTNKELKSIDYTKFIEVLLDTKFRGFYTNKKGGKKSYAPYSSYIVFLCEKLNLTPLELINEYTPEAINYLTEGIIWNINEQSKEGRLKNQIKTELEEAKQGDNDKDLEEIRKMRENRKLQSNK